ncbi:hypothetical protein DFS33DRAFT_1278444 [Desarmillaria ectypa]|nr:hypothetical protein DFS33DRAFT_1278444 [Desarmillaria ectypa]
MWEVCTWIGKVSNYDTELTAYRLLHRLQGWYIPRLFGVVHLCINPESTPLHPITDVVQGLALKFIPGISMEKLKLGIDISEKGAEKISSTVLEGFRAIEAENCLLHNDIHTRNIVLREGDRSPVIVDFGLANIRKPGCSDKERERIVHGGPGRRSTECWIQIGKERERKWTSGVSNRGFGVDLGMIAINRSHFGQG